MRELELAGGENSSWGWPPRTGGVWKPPVEASLSRPRGGSVEVGRDARRCWNPRKWDSVDDIGPVGDFRGKEGIEGEVGRDVRLRFCWEP